MSVKKLPDVEVLRELLSYDPDTGLFTWLIDRGYKARAGAAAGSLNKSGYILISINMERYQAHRIAYKMMYEVEPPDLLDHIDGDTKNNRISNLRPATPKHNQGNTKTPVHNRSGVKGVSWNKKMKRWVAQIGVNNKRVYLGGFHTKEEAACAYTDAARKHFGDFAKGEGL